MFLHFNIKLKIELDFDNSIAYGGIIFEKTKM